MPSRRCAEPLRFLHDAIIAGHHQLLRYATEKALIDTPRTTVVACLMQGNAAYWAHCGDSRLYLVRGDKLIARTRDHSYSELQETLSQVVPMGERFNRNVLFTCLGSPGKPVVDTAGPLLLQPRDRVLLCSDGLWGSVSDADDHRAPGGAPDLRRGARTGGAGAAQRRRQERQRDRARGRVGSRRGRRRRQPRCRRRRSATRCSPRPSRPACSGENSTPDELDEAEIERSIREINEAIQRSSQKKT